MPISVDSTGSGTGGAGGATTYSWSHTVSAPNALLVVGANHTTVDGDPIGSEPTGIASIRWGTTNAGSTFTLQATTITGGSRTEMWTLFNPTTGTTSIHIVYNATDRNRNGMSIALAGINTANPIRTSYSYAVTGTSISTQIASSVGDMLVDVIGISALTDSSLVAGSSQTEIGHVLSGVSSVGSNAAISMSYKVASASSGQTSIGWVWDGSRTANLSVISVAASLQSGSQVFWMY